MIEQLELTDLKKLFKDSQESPALGFNLWLHEYCQKLINTNSMLTVNVMEDGVIKYQFTKAKQFDDSRAPNEPKLHE